MRIPVLILLFIIASCKSQQKAAQSATLHEEEIDVPHVIVYKTKGNYENLVPVTLSADKSTIVAYPAPTDLQNGNAFLSTTALKSGYWLDNRGINKNVAFLKIDYATYARLKEAPALEKLYSQILDNDPLLELYDCGSRKNFTRVTDQLNQLIDSNQLRKQCKDMK